MTATDWRTWLRRGTTDTSPAGPWHLDSVISEYEFARGLRAGACGAILHKDDVEVRDAAPPQVDQCPVCHREAIRRGPGR